VQLDVALAQHWRLTGSLQIFYLSYQQYRGGLADTGLAVEYLPFKHLGFGLGYNAVRYKLEASDTGDLGWHWNGKIEYSFGAVLLYAKLFF
jgi:hypothetical protein